MENLDKAAVSYQIVLTKMDKVKKADGRRAGKDRRQSEKHAAAHPEVASPVRGRDGSPNCAPAWRRCPSPDGLSTDLRANDGMATRVLRLNHLHPETGLSQNRVLAGTDPLT